MYWLKIQNKILSENIEGRKPAELQIDLFVPVVCMMASLESINQSTHVKYDQLPQQISKSINQCMQNTMHYRSKFFQINQSTLTTPCSNIA